MERERNANSKKFMEHNRPDKKCEQRDYKYKM